MGAPPICFLPTIHPICWNPLPVCALSFGNFLPHSCVSGLEADEDEEEKKDEPADGEEGPDKKEGEAGAAAAGGAAPSQASVGGSVESESVMDEDELGGEVFDAEDLDRLAEEREVRSLCGFGGGTWGSFGSVSC